MSVGTVAKLEGRTSTLSAAREGARRLVPLLALLCVVPGILHVVVVCRVVLGRLGHRVDLEWMESGMLYESTRLLEGLPVYAAPEGPYLPFPYPIGYPALLAGLGAVFGVSHPLGRALSFTWTVVASVVLARQVYRHYLAASAGPRGALIAAALALGCIGAGYAVVDGWYDLVRVDTMAMGLLVCGAAHSLRIGEGRAGQRGGALGSPHGATLVTALLLCTALLTKQSTLPGALWVILCALLRSRRGGARLAALTCVFGGSALALLQWATEGHYWFYTVTLLSEHSLSSARLREAHRVLFDFAPYGPLVAIFGGLLALQGRLTPRSLLWAGLFAIGWGFGLASFAKVGGYHNNLLPAVWLAGPAFLLVGADVLAFVGDRRDGVLRWGALCSLALLLATKPLPLEGYHVTSEGAERGQRLRAYVSALPGTVLIPLAPQVAHELGKGVHQLHLEALYDFQWAGRSAGDPLGAHLRAFRPDYVLLDGRELGIEAVLRDYTLVDVLGADRHAWTITGWPVAPRFLLAPRVERRHARVLFDFEEEHLDGWSLEGVSFQGGIAREPGCGQAPFVNGRGEGVLTSYHPRWGDRTRGVALSPPFLVDRPALGMLVAGGWSEATRVELRVAGESVRRISGMARPDLREVYWDVSDLMGREARVALVDAAEGPWGHVTVDDVVLFEPVTPSSAPRSPTTSSAASSTTSSAASSAASSVGAPRTVVPGGALDGVRGEGPPGSDPETKKAR